MSSPQDFLASAGADQRQAEHFLAEQLARTRLRASLWMLVASLLFACMGVCVKLAAASYSAPEIVFYRSAIALVLMLVLMRLRGVHPVTPLWRLQLWRGGSGFVSLLLYFYAITLLPLATAVTLNYTSPLFLALYFALFSGMRLRRPMVLALLLGFVGVAVLLQPTLREDQWLGAAVALGSGVLAGMAYFNVRQLGEQGEPESRTVFYFSLISTVLSGGWMLLAQTSPIDLQGGLLLLGVGVFASLAQLAMTRAYKQGTAIVSASLAYTTVIFASLFGMLLWDEHLPPVAWLGIALIVISGVAATRFSRGRKQAHADRERQ